MAARILPSADHLNQLLIYCQEDGNLTWRVRPREMFTTKRSHNAWNTRYAGKTAGLKKDGYVKVVIGHTLYRAHRVVWKMMTGYDPDEIDHKDLDGLNNKWDNLREATSSQNKTNKKMRSDSGIGFKGVCRSPKAWYARIRVRDKRIHLGTFKTPELAHEAYCKAAKELHGEFWNPG